MTHDPRLEEYLAVCQAMYERMQRDGAWPWCNNKEKKEDNTDDEL